MPDRAKGAARVQKTSGPKRHRPWDAVLDAWARGESGARIADALGLSQSAVTHMVWVSRKRGDPRAVQRKAAAGKGGTGSVVAGQWVPYWGDPRQLVLPFPSAEA